MARCLSCTLLTQPSLGMHVGGLQTTRPGRRSGGGTWVGRAPLIRRDSPCAGARLPRTTRAAALLLLAAAAAVAAAVAVPADSPLTVPSLAPSIAPSAGPAAAPDTPVNPNCTPSSITACVVSGTPGQCTGGGFLGLGAAPRCRAANWRTLVGQQLTAAAAPPSRGENKQVSRQEAVRACRGPRREACLGLQLGSGRSSSIIKGEVTPAVRRWDSDSIVFQIWILVRQNCRCDWADRHDAVQRCRLELVSACKPTHALPAHTHTHTTPVFQHCNASDAGPPGSARAQEGAATVPPHR